VPVTFQNSSVVTAKTPDGRWFDVRIVVDDGRWRVTKLPTYPPVLALVYLLILGLLRLAYWVRRSTRKSIEIIAWPVAGNSRPQRMSSPVHREVASDGTAARARAADLVEALTRGDLRLD